MTYFPYTRREAPSPKADAILTNIDYSAIERRIVEQQAELRYLCYPPTESGEFPVIDGTKG